MMKFGRNDFNWHEGKENWDKFCGSVVMFNIESFQPFMKRKTLDNKDMEMLEALEEMVKMMREYAEKIEHKN